MPAGGGRRFALTALPLLAVSAALLAWMTLSYGPAFSALTGGRTIPDLQFAGYDKGLVLAYQKLLLDRPEAAAILRGLHLGPDLLFPGVATGLFLLVLIRFVPGSRVYGRPLSPVAAALVICVPLGYCLADYAENIASLLVFPPAVPSAQRLDLLASLLPWFTRFKWLFFAVSAILVVRFAIFHYWLGPWPDRTR